MNNFFKTNTKHMIFENLLDQAQQVVDPKNIIQDLEDQIHDQLFKNDRTEFTITLNPDKYVRADNVINLTPLRATQLIVWIYCEQNAFAYYAAPATTFNDVDEEIQLLDVRIDPWLNYHIGC